MTTIAPTDRVRHRMTGRVGLVVALSEDGAYAYVHWDGWQHTYAVSIVSLELLEAPQ